MGREAITATSGSAVYTTTTDAQGYSSFTVPAGTYTVIYGSAVASGTPGGSSESSSEGSSLQRQLAAESTTFRDLLDIYRQEQALFLLQQGKRDLANVAYSLGYKEQSSFNRAFRRWTGTSPFRWLK
ncbi:MAG: AraC family transcriptional regulator [Chloroflexi bacterium]|nr:AraC family transcriptional regulator [Chloroflexota bacterium]